MYQLGNEHLQVSIDPKGAELKSIYSKAFSLEYMWNADPVFWAKTSPVLFPIVGTLKKDTYHYKGQAYKLSRHGFARDKVFTITAQSNDSITFTLESDTETEKVYPFSFLFSITYTLADNELIVSYRVHNKGEESMLFSVGAHPAFSLPLVQGTAYTDYQLYFEKEETAGRWPISNDGLIEKSPQPLLHQTAVLPLTKELFRKDAIVLKHLKSAWVQLQSDKTPHGWRFTFPGFPYLGLWAAPEADFICIEPWCGIADCVDADQQWPGKEGLNSLTPATDFYIQWSVQCY